MSKSSRVGLCVLLTATVFSSLSYAVTPDRIAGALNGGQSVTLRGNVHRQARPEFDQGAVDPAFKLTYMTLLTTPTASQIKALKKLLAEQQDRNSPNYHKWLTPEQWADRFGLSSGDAAKITTWLKSQGFTVISVARGRNWIVFSGTAAQAQNAFGTDIHRYNVNGEMHFANATELRIPGALSGIVSGIRGLNDFRPKPTGVKTARAAVHGDYYDLLFAPPTPPDFIAPGDIATMYDIHALYTAGFDGTGQKLAIPGQTDVYLADLNDFRQGFGITQISGCTTNSGGAISSCSGGNFQYILNGPDPGVSLGDLTEADLDLEWSNAVARNATIVYVNSGTAGGVWDSWYYAVDHSVAPVISLSYGLCEFFDNQVIDPSTGLPAADELELMKANGLGITIMNSTGDSGAAGCDAGQNPSSGNLAIGGLAVGYPASSPEVTGVGGTAVEYPTGFSTTYWTTTNAADGGSAQNPPIPETAWNDDEELALAYGQFTAQGWQQNYAIVSTGGGASNCATQTTNFLSCAAGFPQPSWQTVSVAGQASVRFSPDVSALGSPNFPGYIFCTAKNAWIGGTSSASTCASGIPGALSLTDSGGNPAPSLVGGTSASSPAFAGIVVLLNQYLGESGLGNINPGLYTLAADTANGAFHQVTTGDNNVYCEPGTPTALPVALQCPASGIFGFSASNADTVTGYNLVTGLGSVDADKLAIAWIAAFPPPDFDPPLLAPSSDTVVAGHNSTAITVTITPLNGYSQATTLSCSAPPTGAACTFSPNPVTPDGTNPITSTLTIATNASMATGALPMFNITAANSGASISHSSGFTLTVNATDQSFTLAPGASSYSVAQGGTVSNASVTLTGTNGFSTANSPVSYTCTDPASESICTATANSTGATFNITTRAPSFAKAQPLGRGSRIFYAAFLPGLLGILFTAGTRKRSLRGMRVLGLIVALGCSTVWMASCGGGGSSTTHDPGTPKGSYTITVNATTNGTNPLTASTTFTLQVN